jgi:mono/diheme cytochrome c family protein
VTSIFKEYFEMRKNLTFILIIALMAVFLSACGGEEPVTTEDVAAPVSDIPAEYAEKTNPLADSSDAIAEGKSVFESTCSACHGDIGLGDGPAAASLTPPPASLVELNKTAADDYLLWRISEGKEGTAMVGWKTSLSEDQLWQVISYIRTFK